MIILKNASRNKRVGSAKCKLSLLLYFFVAASNVSAAEDACLPYKKMLDEPIAACKCGSNLSGQYRLDRTAEKIIATRQLPLVAVCKYQWHSIGATGSFYFRGGAEVTGEFRREETTSEGDSFWLLRFSPASFTQVPSFDLVSTLNLEITKSSISRLHPPALSEETPCWVTPVTVYIREFFIRLDAGTDNGGAVLTKYDVMKVGKYSRCEGAG